MFITWLALLGIRGLCILGCYNFRFGNVRVNIKFNLVNNTLGLFTFQFVLDRKSTRLNSSHT